MPVTQTGFSELTAIQKKILRPIDVFMQSPPANTKFLDLVSKFKNYGAY